MWSRSPSIVWGGILVLVGLLFLLNNLVPDIRWDIVWPVVVIAAGVWFLAARIGPAGSYADVDSAESRDGITQATLELSLGAGTVNVKAGALDDQLFKVHIEHQGSSPEVRLDRATATVKISSRFDWLMGPRRFRLDTQISDAVPWTVRCATGAIRGEFDLATAQLKGFDCRTGASRITINLPAPKGVVPVRIDGGALRVDLVRPEGSAIKVQSTGGALQLHTDGAHQEGVGNREWRSAGFDSAADRYEVSVAGGALNVNVSARQVGR